MTRGIARLFAAAVIVLAAHAAAAAPRPLRGIAVNERLDEAPVLADLVRSLPATPTLPLVARIAIDHAAFAGAAAAAAFDRLDARVALYAARSIPVVIAVGALPATEDGVEPWRVWVRAIAERERGKVAAIAIGDAADSLPAVERYAYLLKLAAVQIRSIDAGVLVLEGPVPSSAVEWQRSVYAAGIATYVDGVAIAGDAAAMEPLIEEQSPTAIIVQGPTKLPDEANAAAEAMVEAELAALGTRRRVMIFDGRVDALRAGLAASARIADLLSNDVVALDEHAAGLRLGAAASGATARVPHRLLYDLTSFDTYLVYTGGGLTTMDVEVSVANAAAPMVRDPVDGTVTKPPRVEHAPTGNGLRLTVRVAPHPLVLDFNYGVANQYTLTAEAQQERLPRVEDIIFRHQQAQAAQDAAVANYTAHVRIEQHFHPTPADPAYNLITENTLFADRAGVEWEELSFKLNGAKWTSNRPAFPLVQPEKVLSLPLDLRLNQDYAYRLDGIDTVDGQPAFVVRFDPVDTRRALYRGTVWIDRRTYVRLKVQAVETHLTGPVVSNDETQIYADVGQLGDRPVWLFDRVISKQIFLIAGRTVLVEREVHLTDFHLNVADFQTERGAARASNRIMYRDTDQGLRYLVKKGEQRVVSNDLTQSAKAFALGVDVDPSLTYPLPIGGLDILDFNFLHRDMQFALLYGGVIALGNLQKANLWGGRFDVSVDFFGLGVKSYDSVFDARGERTGERVTRIPVSTGANLGYQMTPFQKVSAHYQFRYDAYFRDPSTAPDFAVPGNTATNGEGVGYEYRRRGYSATADATAFQRAAWTPWGYGGAAFDPGARTYTQYDAGLSKDFVFATFHTIHLNATYFGGQRLDRFSEYEFGLFDATRMHGVPSAVRFGELAMFRGSYSFNLFDQYRIDLFVDHARGRDPQLDQVWRPVTGLGLGLNLRAPYGTILRADIGHSVLPDVYRGAGTTVIQIMLLKPL